MISAFRRSCSIVGFLALLLHAALASAAAAPIAHWRFDEGTGTSVDDESSNNVTGNFMTPNPTWSTDVPPVTFTNPYSLSFTSTGDGISFVWPSGLNFTGTEERSFAFWYKPTGDGEVASGNYDRIMSWTSDAFEIAGTLGDVAVHRLAFYDGSWRDTGYDLTVGTWFHITFTYDGTNVKLYVAGVPKFSGTSGGRDINGTMYLGVRHTGDEGINGRIDDMRIYDYALTSDQIQNLVNGSDNPDAPPPPTLSGALVPADNATNINGSANLVMTFNKIVQGGTGSIVIKKSSDDSTIETIPAQSARVTGSGTRILTINPTTTLADSTSYYVQVGANAVRSATGAGVFYAGLSGTGSWNFTTGDFAAPSATAFSPADDATGVSTTTDLAITFDQTTRAGTGTLTIKKSSDDSTIEAITVSGALLSGNSSTELTLNPSTTLSAGTSYYVVWSANAFKDTSGNHTSALTSSTTWNFTTASTSSSSSSSSSSSNETIQAGGGRRGGPGDGGIPPALTGPRSIAPATGQASGAPAAQRVNVSTTNADGQTIIFRDVWTDDWHGPYVRKLVDMQIFEGYKNATGEPLGLYGPGDSITVGQLAKVVALLAKKPVREVRGNDWAIPFVAAAKALKLTAFQDAVTAEAPATRGAVIQAILEALGIPLQQGGDLPYVDVAPGSPYARGILTATMLGIVSGDDGTNNFRPNDPINRAEVAKMIVEALHSLQN